MKPTAGFEGERVSKACRASDKAYSEFVCAVNSFAFVLGDGSLDGFIALLNTEIRRVKVQVLKEKPDTPVANQAVLPKIRW